jgi:GGDEF domain-containing protein
MSTSPGAARARTGSDPLGSVRARVRDTDLVFRGPGDGIGVVLRDCSQKAAQHVVRRLHAAAATAAPADGNAAIECFVCPSSLAATSNTDLASLPLVRVES